MSATPKILHLSGNYFPTGLGGKENFVRNIILGIPDAEHRIMFHDPSGPSTYVHEGVRVDVFPLPPTRDARQSYFSLTYDDIPGFRELLNSFQPDIVHFHDMCAGASLSHLRICKEMNFKTITTYHTASSSCLQRSLAYLSKLPCDGYIDVTRCTYCRYVTRGVTSIAGIASRIQVPFDPGGKYFLRAGTRLFHDSWHEFHNTVDVIQIHAPWVADMMAINNVPKDKVRFIDMGGREPLPSVQQPDNTIMKIAFVGRCIPAKGIHLLIEAVKNLPEVPLEVYFFGPHWDDAYGMELRKKIETDPRFIAPEYFAPQDVVQQLATMDLCVIPSIMAETGPLTVFDAFAAGVPVLGANEFGIADRVVENENGFLFEWNNARSLQEKLFWITNNRDILRKVRTSVKALKTAEDFSNEMRSLYLQVMSGNKPA